MSERPIELLRGSIMNVRRGAFTCPECGHTVEPPPSEILRLGGLTVDTGTYEIRVWGQPRHLPPTPTTLLIAMMRRPGVRFSHDDMMNVIDAWETGPRIICVYVHRIRHAIGDAVDVRTHWGRGYSLHPIEASAPRELALA